MEDTPRRARNVHLVRERLRSELEESADWVEERISSLFPGVVGLLVNPLARLIYHWIGRDEVIRRALAQFDLLAEVSREVPERGVDAVVSDHLDALLRTEEAHVRARKKHPDYPELRRLLRQLIEDRVRVIGRILNTGEGDTYEAVVASAIPRKEVEAALESHFRTVDAVVALTRDAPRLLPIPRVVRGEMFRLIDETVAWYRGRLDADLDAIYGATAA